MVEGLPLVTITGVTGFAGSWTALLCIKSGKYRVRGTVRSTSNTAKIDPLRQSFGEFFDQLELVEADLTDAASIERAIQGSTYVLHLASPLMIEEPRDENELIRPAVDGALSVMRACAKHGVQRVAMTSSIASIVQLPPEQRPDVFDETYWSDPNYDKIAAYEKSKTLAERAAWDYVNGLPEDQKFGLAVINPGWIVGPALINSDFASGKVIKMFMQDRFPGGIPYIKFGMVDVRDVAQAHINCLDSDAAQGHRHILVGQGLWMREIGAILTQAFPTYPIPQSESKYCLVKFASFFRADAAKVAQYWGHDLEFDTTRSKEALRIEYARPMSETIQEMANSMIDFGIIEDQRPK